MAPVWDATGSGFVKKRSRDRETTVAEAGALSTRSLDHAGMALRGGDCEARVGDVVLAQDGPLGRVESLIRSESQATAYLVVAAGKWPSRRYPVVPCALVATVDRCGGSVRLRGRRRALARLSETPPILV
jgi:hypothetical protein